MRDAFIEQLTELADQDESIMLLTGDLGFGVLEDFSKNFLSNLLMSVLQSRIWLDWHAAFL